MNFDDTINILSGKHNCGYPQSVSDSPKPSRQVCRMVVNCPGRITRQYLFTTPHGKNSDGTSQLAIKSTSHLAGQSTLLLASLSMGGLLHPLC